jgi:hypothetical protein
MSRIWQGQAAPGDPVPAVVQARQRLPVGSGTCSSISRVHKAGMAPSTSANEPCACREVSGDLSTSYPLMMADPSFNIFRFVTA